jgi:hypothetical protein
MAKKTKKIQIVILALLCFAFAGGYYTGRATSTNWNTEQAAFLYMCRASHRAKNSSLVLELALPDTIYRFDGVADPQEMPIASAVAGESYPLVGADEYEHWLDGVVGFAAAGATKPIWDTISDEAELSRLQRFLIRERVLVTALTIGSFTGGYFIGHKVRADFNAPEFRKALRSKRVWQKVWQYKGELSAAKRRLDIASENLTVAGDHDLSADRKIARERQNIQKDYESLYILDPDLKR